MLFLNIMDNLDPETRDLISNLANDFQYHLNDNPVSGNTLPDRNVIVRILKNLQSILFPKHFCPEESRIDGGHALLMSVLADLSGQIFSALHAARENRQKEISRLKAAAENKTAVFLRTIPEIRQQLMADARAAFENDPAASGIDEVILCYPGIFAIMVYRIAHELHLLSVPLIPRLMSECAHAVTGIDIHPGATIGSEFFIDHGTGVVIGETSIIGERVRIYQGVTLGARSTHAAQALRHVKRHPTIENGVTIYSGATVLGGDTVIGEDATIGGNAFVTQSVPAVSRAVCSGKVKVVQD